MKATKPCNLPSPFDAKKIARQTQNGPNHSMSRCGVRDKVRMKVIFFWEKVAIWLRIQASNKGWDILAYKSNLKVFSGK